MATIVAQSILILGSIYSSATLPVDDYSLLGLTETLLFKDGCEKVWYQMSEVGRRLREDFSMKDGQEWPEWLSAGDRGLLQVSTVTPNVMVAANGIGNFRTIFEAVAVAAAAAAAPEGSSRYVIRTRAGVYKENVEIPWRKTNLMFVGDGWATTIITACRSVGGGSTTFNSGTVG